jgi:hypothetical protein
MSVLAIELILGFSDSGKEASRDSGFGNSPRRPVLLQISFN